MTYKRAIFALMIFVMITACSGETSLPPKSDETEIVGMTLEEWHELDELGDVDHGLALIAQQMPGFAGYHARDGWLAIMRSPVPSGGVSLPADTPYPNLEGATPIMDRSTANVHGMLKLMRGDDFPGFVFYDAEYDARQMYHWKLIASSLMFSDQIDAVGVDFKESTNKIVVDTSITTDEASATIRRTLVDAGIPSEALVIRQGVITWPLPEPL
ncbi:MAG: hypothetical protein AAF267_04755 [Deinococcota bacterium]